MFEDDNLIPQQVGQNANRYHSWNVFPDLYIDALPTLWYKQWGFKFIKWRETKYIVWKKPKALNWSQTRWDIAIKVKLIKVKFCMIIIKWFLLQ